MVKHADSERRDCQFEFSMCHNQNAIGKDSNGKPPHELNFPREELQALSLVSATLEIEYATQLRLIARTRFYDNVVHR